MRIKDSKSDTGDNTLIFKHCFLSSIRIFGHVILSHQRLMQAIEGVSCFVKKFLVFLEVTFVSGVSQIHSNEWVHHSLERNESNLDL